MSYCPRCALKSPTSRFHHQFFISTLKNNSGMSIRWLTKAQTNMAKPITQTCILLLVPWARKCILDILAGDCEVAPSHTRPVSNDPLMDDGFETRTAILISRCVLAWQNDHDMLRSSSASTKLLPMSSTMLINLDCLTTFLAVLVVQGTSLCRHAVNRHGVIATNQSEQRAHTLGKKSADHRMFEFRVQEFPRNTQEGTAFLT